VLLKLVNVCAVYCRFCSAARWFGPGRQMLSPTRSTRRLASASRPEIWEVIFTGGDPLVLSGAALKRDHPRIAGSRT